MYRLCQGSECLSFFCKMYHIHLVKDEDKQSKNNKFKSVAYFLGQAKTQARNNRVEIPHKTKDIP